MKFIRNRIVVATILFATTPLLVHVILCWRLGLEWSIVDIRGMGSSFVVSFILAALLALLPEKIYRIVFITVNFIWVVLHNANLESVLALGDTVDLSFVGYIDDLTFFKGSVLHIEYPLFPIIMCTVAILCALFVVSTRCVLNRISLFLIIFLSIVVLWLIPFDMEIPSWRQRDCLVENLIIRFAPIGSVASDNVGIEENKLLSHPDLQGEQRLLGEKKNILLIFLESVSQFYLSSALLPDGQINKMYMPNLARIAEENIAVEMFFSHNRQTNRGEYSVLCGDYPNLVAKYAKMDNFAERNKDENRTCLPQLLRNEGYYTAYLQAAPINFMSKDVFMAAVGFDEVHGFTWFRPAQTDNIWGLDDGQYLQQSLDKIKELQDSGNPWFLTMLTVGTHHPFPLPKKWNGRSGVNNFVDTLLYLDESIDTFVSELSRMGILDDTLVIITSDESAGAAVTNKGGGQLLYSNWIPFIIIDKGIEPRKIKEVYGQSDIALSIVDYLKVPFRDSKITGRSIFRTYETKRPILFGNTYYQKINYFNPEQGLTSCRYGFSECITYQTVENPFVDTLVRLEEPSKPSIAFIKNFLSLNEIYPSKNDNNGQLIQLIPPDTELQLYPKKTPQNIFGFKYLDIPKDSIVKIDILFSVTGAPVLIDHDILAEKGAAGKLYAHPQVEVIPGSSLTFSYKYLTRKQQKDFEVRMFATNMSGIRAKIIVDHAEISYEPRYLPWGNEGVLSFK